MPAGDSDILKQIDAAIALDDLCACGCTKPVGPRGFSPWFASEACQERFQRRHASDAAPLTVLPPDHESRALDPVENLVQANPSLGHRADHMVFDEIHQWAREFVDTDPVGIVTAAPQPIRETAASITYEDIQRLWDRLARPFFPGSPQPRNESVDRERLQHSETPTAEKRVLFIDGPLAGHVQVLQSHIREWRVPLPLPPLTAVDFINPPTAMVSPEIVSYRPVGGGSQHHTPQPWTSMRPPTNDAEYCKALATAWYQLHGPSSQGVQS